MNRRDYKLTDITTAAKIKPGMVVRNHHAQVGGQTLKLVVDVQKSAMTNSKGRNLVRLIHDQETGNGWVFDPSHPLSVYTPKRGR